MQLQQLKAESVKLSPQERLALVSAIIESLHNVSVSESDRSAAIKRMRGLYDHVRANGHSPLQNRVVFI